MQIQKESLERLRQELEAAVQKKIQTPKDFEYLSDCIFQKLHEKISPTTLKRLWGYIPETSTPRVSTLNLLAEFLDYQDWDAFCRQESQTSPSSPQEETAPQPSQQESPIHRTFRTGCCRCHFADTLLPFIKTRNRSGRQQIHHIHWRLLQ